jgi:hypothetical protein
MKQDLSRFNQKKDNEDVAENVESVVSASYNLGEVNVDVDDYIDEVKYDLPEDTTNDLGHPNYDLVKDQDTGEKKHWEDVDKEKQLEEFKQREQQEKEALEEYSRKAREDEEVSITEDEVTPTIIENVKITDLTDDDAKKKT